MRAGGAQETAPDLVYGAKEIVSSCTWLAVTLLPPSHAIKKEMYLPAQVPHAAKLGRRTSALPGR
jgi:hypothetical protein